MLGIRTHVRNEDGANGAAGAWVWEYARGCERGMGNEAARVKWLDEAAASAEYEMRTICTLGRVKLDSNRCIENNEFMIDNMQEISEHCSLHHTCCHIHNLVN